MEPGCDTSDKVGAIDWIVEAVENLVNLCFVAKFGRLARSADEQYGPWIASGFGVVHLSLSIHQGVKAVDEAEGDPLGTLESVLGSVPASLKFLRTDALIEATELGSWFVLLIFDLACGIGTSAFGLARAYRASAAPAH